MINKVVKDIIELAQEPIQLTVGESKSALKFNYFETLKRVDFYVNSQYLEGNDGVFWNIINSRIVHFAKNIDLDTKDLRPYADGEASYVQSWILGMKFYKWLEDNHFALTLNGRSIGLATYGSWVWKVKKEDGKTVVEDAPLQNLYFDQTAKSVRDVNVVQKHMLSRDALKGKGEVWEGVDRVLSQTKDEEIEIWEFNGEYDGVFQQVIGYGTDDNFVELYVKEIKESPYYDFHIGEYQGRWLRVGVAERLFDLQVLANRKINQNEKNQEIASLLLMRTSNPELIGNVLQDVEPGEIINSEDLQQIGITNTTFNSFITEMQQIENKADQLSLTPNIITSEQTPANIPFRSLATLTNAGKSAFRLIKESVGESTGYLLKERIFPDVVKEWNKGEVMEISRDEADVRYFEKQIRKLMKWRTFTSNLLEGKEVRLEDLDEVDRVLDAELEQMPKKIRIPEKFFNFDFHIKTNITGEAVDKTQRNDALFNTLTWVQSNPAIVNVPYFRQYCEENGINYWRLTPEQKEELVQQAGGGAPEAPIKEAGKSADKLLSAVDTQ